MSFAIRSRVALGVGVPLVAGVSLQGILFAFQLTAMEASESERLHDAAVTQVLRARTDVAYALVESYGKAPDVAQAQAEALGHLASMRFGADDSSYLWVHTLDPAAPDRPVMVMHPTKPALNGTDVANFVDKERFKRIWFGGEEYANADPAVAAVPSTNLFVDMNRALLASSDRSAVVRYYWPDPARSMDVGYEKVSFVRYYAPWKWVIGTGEYADNIDAAAAQVEARMHDESQTALWRVAIAGLLLVGALTAILLYIAEHVARPVRAAAERLEAVAAGDLDGEIEPVGGAELERLAVAFNQTLARIREALGAHHVRWDSVASGREVQARLTSAAERFTAISGTLASAAGQTASMTGSLSSSATEVSDHLGRVSSGTEDISTAMNVIARNTADAVNAVRTGVEAARGATETVQRLDQSSRAIGEVVKAISAIAEQTNLLALNATIEAARAGEAGTGFAVVAAEVKELARGTKLATEDIQRRIGAIQRDSVDASDAIGRIASAVSHIQELQEAVAAAVEEQAATSRLIANDVASSANQSAAMAGAVGQIGQAMEDVTRSARSVSEAATDLSALATQLQEVEAADVGEARRPRRKRRSMDAPLARAA